MKTKIYIVTICLIIGAIGNSISQDKDQDQLLALLEAYEDAETNSKKAMAMYEIGQMYEMRSIYKQSLQSYEKALELGKDDHQERKYSLLEKLSNIAVFTKDYEKSILYREQLIQLEKEQGKETLSSQKLIANVAIVAGNYEKALEVLEEIIQNTESSAELAQAYNNQGYVYKKQENIDKANTSFQKALEIYQSQEKEGNTSTDIYNNIGISYSYLGDYFKAIDFFEKSKRVNVQNGDKLNEARSYNYIGATQYIRGDNLQAQKALENAIRLGEEASDKQVVSESYKILAEVFTAEKDFEASQDALKKHLDLKEQVEKEAEAKRKESLQKQIDAERNENALKQALAQKREQKLALKQAKLEADQRKNELRIQQQQLDLLSREKELQETQLTNQKLEKQRVQQALRLAQEQLDKQKREREIVVLQQEKERQEAELKQREMEERENQRAMELLEAEKQLQDQKLAQESANKKIYIGGFVLIGAFLVFVLYTVIQRGKANKVLKTQQTEIKEKNEELLASEEEIRQNMEELQTTQELLAEQKEELQVQFQKVTHSINYGETIQNAILPHVSLRDKIFPENFLIFMPKDIVSGDFYWVSEHGDKRLIAVIDCTGHGVPGAFMSMIGHNVLTEIIEQMGIYDPATILNILHKQIRKKLNQEEGANNDGMDLGICLLQDMGNGKTEMTYSGAKHQLFFVKDGESERVYSDRKSIGGKYATNEIEFSNQRIELSTSDKIYLTSDGFLDQSNEQRRKFTSKRFMEIISKHHLKPFYEQKLIFENALAEHQQNSDQRDDITVFAISV